MNDFLFHFNGLNIPIDPAPGASDYSLCSPLTISGCRAAVPPGLTFGALRPGCAPLLESIGKNRRGEPARPCAKVDVGQSLNTLDVRRERDEWHRMVAQHPMGLAPLQTVDSS